MVFGSKATSKNTYIFLFHFLFFCYFVKKKYWKYMTHFRTISGPLLANYIKIFHKSEVQMVILRCLVCLNPNWIKSYDLICITILFSKPENASFVGYFMKWVLTPQKETGSLIIKMDIFPKFSGCFYKPQYR